MRRVLVAIVAAAISLIGQADAAPLPRLVSINVCADQLLLTLADPQQILGVSPYAYDPRRSYLSEQAKAFRRMSGEAEDVMVLKPDFVVSTRFTRRATRELLKQQGFRVIELDAVQTLDAVKAQILKIGELVGHPDRAVAANARIDAAVARARSAALKTPLRVLPLERRGWVSGGDSLLSSLLTTVGLTNAAGSIGIQRGGFASLEAVVASHADYLLMSEDGEFAEDQGRAFVLHPALEKLYPPSKRITIPERLTVCGGPSLADALDLLTEQISRIERSAK